MPTTEQRVVLSKLATHKSFIEFFNQKTGNLTVLAGGDYITNHGKKTLVTNDFE